jgi:rhodanese-related sulfurtransferase
MTLEISSFQKEDLNKFVLVDLREPAEVFLRPVKAVKCMSLPLTQYSRSGFQFKKDQNYILFCASGGRSRMLAERLHREGITNVSSLAGGMNTLEDCLKK